MNDTLRRAWRWLHAVDIDAIVVLYVLVTVAAADGYAIGHGDGQRDCTR